MKTALGALGLALSFGAFTLAWQTKEAPRYRVLAGTSQGNLTVFPVISGSEFGTGLFLTLDEGIRSGEVVVTEAGQTTGLVRPRAPLNDGVFQRRLPVAPAAPRVGELALINNSDRPLLLLAGELVTGGKQDRVVSKDRIVTPHSEPVGLSVFCVEPHRWTGTSLNFATPKALMAQPSVRAKAMAAKDQEQVWNEVAKSRGAMMSRIAPPAAAPLRGTSSYAASVGDQAVQAQIDSVAKPLAQSYDGLIQKLRAEKAVGAVVALNGEIIWADVFASSELLNRFWPKLLRSYSAESFGQAVSKHWASQDAAQAFLDRIGGTHETVDTEPGLFRNTEIAGEGYSAFVLTSLLPGHGFNVHLAKMKN